MCCCCSVAHLCWTLRPHGLQHARSPCPSPSPEACPRSCPLHQWYHPTISSSDGPLLFQPCLSQHLGLFQWVGYSHQVTKILQLQHQSFQPVSSIVTGSISLLSKGLSGVFCSTTVQRHQFFGTPPSLQFSCHNSTWPGEHHSLDYMDLCWQSNVSAFQYTVWVCHSFPAKRQLSFNCMAAVTIHSDFRAQEEEICHCFHLFPFYLLWSDGTGCHDLFFF